MRGRCEHDRAVRVANPPDFFSFSELPLLRSLTSDDHRPNLLIVCGDVAMDTVVAQLRLMCGSPLHACRLPGFLDLPALRCGTLLLENVGELTIGQQIGLAEWIDRRRGVQVVSVARAPLAPLVADGSFLEGVFHRLSTVSLRASKQEAHH